MSAEGLELPGPFIEQYRGLDAPAGIQAAGPNASMHHASTGPVGQHVADALQPGLPHALVARPQEQASKGHIVNGHIQVDAGSASSSSSS